MLLAQAKIYRLKLTTTNGWRDFGHLEQRNSCVLFPIQIEKGPDSGIFARIVSCPPLENRLQR